MCVCACVSAFLSRRSVTSSGNDPRRLWRETDSHGHALIRFRLALIACCVSFIFHIENVAWLTVGAIWQLGWAWNKTSGSLHFKLCNCRSEILLQHTAGESERLGRWLNWGCTVYSLKLRREESREVFKKECQKPWTLYVLNADYYQMESNPTPPDGSQLYNLFRIHIPLLTGTFVTFISLQLKDQNWKKLYFGQKALIRSRFWRLEINQTRRAQRFP